MNNILKNALTVAELIKKLQTLPQNLPVVLEGYEGGYNHELRFEAIEIALYVHTEDYLGNHEQPDYMTAEKQAKTYHLEQALVIRGCGRNRSKHDDGTSQCVYSNESAQYNVIHWCYQ